MLTDPDVPAPARRGVITDLLESRVSATTLRLVIFALDADRASEFVDNVTWLAERLDAASRGLVPVGDAVLGRHAAIERVDGYATALLDDIPDKGTLGDIEDELFRFMRIVGGIAGTARRLIEPGGGRRGPPVPGRRPAARPGHRHDDQPGGVRHPGGSSPRL